jgi:hypothetical protein
MTWWNVTSAVASNVDHDELTVFLYEVLTIITDGKYV